ncbi:hypothetical protein Pla52o_00880 [Novipirellula galeiformis]|uniref:DUF124 domain-containing protein n=1 Tax=Novipirellula galeiformis TaxID=2528004 RepID=A0A5C6CQM8_9BACT|nr:TIGR00266 family protein [Novipirellula galeiformis]TWU26235.1 hypothetical protein Pla52o_00880 [Novipirellula galeiformis]
MEFCVKHAPVCSTLEFSLSQDEYVVAQPNSMLTMTAGIVISAHAGRLESPAALSSPAGERAIASSSPSPRGRSSWLGGFKSMLGGESFFTAEFRAKSDEQTVVLAPESYGDIVALDLQPDTGYFLTRGSYLANVGSTNVRVKYGGLKGMMSKKGLFLMHATGHGTVFCHSYGAIVHHRLSANETLLVDNRFMVAFSDTVQYRLVKASDSLKDSLMSGEGLINHYSGPGDIYYQTRGKPSGGFLTTLIDVAF